MGGQGENGLNNVIDLTSSLFLFSLGTQCALALIFAVVFVALARAARHPPYFDLWKRAWIARAVGLSAILVRFLVPLSRGIDPSALDGSLFSNAAYTVYQGAKLLCCWWLLEGVRWLAGRSTRPAVGRAVVAGILLASFGTVLLSPAVEGLLLFQAPAQVVSSLLAAWLLLLLPPAQRSAGSRITAGALLAQATLWVLYSYALTQVDHGPWPLVRTPWTILAAHNSYFDLALDVLLAAGLVVLLLQDVHRRQLEAEADRARLRAEFERSERLRSLGTLVSGVAHELNNPLTAILGFAEALSTTARAEQARQVGIIREQALRCRRIVQGLSTFSGRGSEVFEHLELRPLLERVVRGFEFELARKRVRVELCTEEDLPTVNGDRFALEQMVANLLANALHAGPPGSRVTISAHALAHEIELSVEDEGSGFPADIQGRVFDPFFTTRMPGEGTGLGLAVVHGIVTAHGGTIRAENRTSKGARVSVKLPTQRSAKTATTGLLQRDIPRPVSPPAPAALELLVIEDEVLLCEMLGTLGRRRGWRVTLATTGKEGLERLRAEGGRFDAVLCDLRMASPSGIEIHDLLLEEAPERLERFLFVTGDADSFEARRFVERCTRPILRKPFGLEELAQRIEGIAVLHSAG